MKRFGMYNDDFKNMFECYSRVSPEIVMENTLPSMSRKSTPAINPVGHSFPGAKFCKIFIQQPGRGADLRHLGKVTRIESDDGEGNTVISAEEGDKTLNVVTTESGAQVRMIDSTGKVENEFVTNVAPRFDSSTKEITIIHIEQL
jgi:hypothetical protein